MFGIYVLYSLYSGLDNEDIKVKSLSKLNSLEENKSPLWITLQCSVLSLNVLLETKNEPILRGLCPKRVLEGNGSTSQGFLCFSSCFFSHVFVLGCVIVSVFWTRLCLYIPGCSDSLDIPGLRPTRSWVAGVHHDSQHAGNCSIRRRASFNKWRGKLVLYNIWELAVNKIKCKGRRKKTEKRVDSPSFLVCTLDPQGKENGKEWQHVRMLWSGYTHWCQPPTHIVDTNKCD